jgi:exodeoxyribonuclease X
MTNVLFLDTETPGFAKPMRPIESATIFAAGDSPMVMVTGDRTVHRWCCPKEVFEYGAMAVHNILPDDVALCPSFNVHEFRDRHLGGVDYLIGHNIDFDWEVVGKPDVKRICSLAVCRYFWPDLDAHKLGAMMYYIFGANNETRSWLTEAHSAGADVENCMNLLVKVAELKGINTWTRMYGISEMGRIPYRMTFGKHGPKDGRKGMIIADMVKNDPGYVRWMKNNMDDMDPYLRKALDNPRVLQ